MYIGSMDLWTFLIDLEAEVSSRFLFRIFPVLHIFSEFNSVITGFYLLEATGSEDCIVFKVI